MCCLSVPHQFMKCLETFTTLVAYLVTLRVSLMVEPAHSKGTAIQVSAGLVRFVGLVNVFLEINPIDEVFAAGPACIRSILLGHKGSLVA